MDPVRPEQMTDAALDREIAAALNVEPSPDFVARVRQRVADAPVPSAWGVSWSAGAAASLALAGVAAMIFWIDSSGPRTGVTRYDRPSRQSGFIESRTTAGISELQADRRSGRLAPGRSHVHGSSMVQPSSVVSGFPPSLRFGEARRSAERGGGSRTASVVSGFSRTTPEILIDVREANALRALFAGASLGTVDLIPLARAAANAASQLTPPAEIVIAPLVNEPLTPIPGEGARP
jgi:hypothetical protein